MENWMTTNPRGEMPGPADTWPADGVAAMGRCPVCGETRRSLFLDRLRDTIFYSAPGEFHREDMRQ
jgi:hypothetical protein